MPEGRPSNEAVADLLEQIAELLEAQEANPFRVQAYRDGADTIRNTDRNVAKWVEAEGRDVLESLPNIGEGLANTIGEFVETGHSDQLADLQGEVSPGKLFQRVPGIGPELAQRIVDELHISTLEELEMAANDGRLDKVEGFGPERVKGVRTSLAGMLSQSAQRRQQRASQGDPDAQPDEQPPVSLLLDIDKTYRQKAGAGELETIAPDRFNPDGEAWLPIMETERGGWSFTVLYSNTKRAHELGKTHDWVVIYYEPTSGGSERQVTVVTETSGPMEGKRVVRGREAETREDYYGMAS